MPLWLGSGRPLGVGARVNPQVGAQLIPILRVIARHRVKAEKPGFVFARRWRRVFLGKCLLSGTGEIPPIGISAFGHLRAEGPSSRAVVGKRPAAELRLSLSLSCLYPTAARGSAKR